jgi:hypothetical protein
MSFAIRNLSFLTYAQGYTMWHYKANIPTMSSTLVPPASLAEVASPNFFLPAKDMLALGDMIAVSAADGGAMLYVHSTKDDKDGKDVIITSVMCNTRSL